ncbi:DNA mismatch repair protein PMS1-like isoform X3 [Triticum dicoccoides]|uniref:DNA mismatch repair protein PMS1-like isoform X3 n=1 Tax=Triticum dicoccoides TaxID=85692 RepID=UPI0018912165|nr:DNA mismatch repair protein PMS1-like isoform X3 [Triticum dicoccoides]
MGGASPAIKPIGKTVVHRICSGQVIFDLSSAVKELVENSLDAGATTVEVGLKAYGEEWFKVADNGSGISPGNFQALALKHHTSKISDFSDLNSVVTFGFRGEALSSLCALGKLTVETRTKDESVGTHLEFEHSGVVISERKIARQVGTTVTIEKLFSTLPVRGKEFSRNIRKEYGKVISLLHAYALIAKGVRLLCTNTVGKNSKMVVVKTQGSSSLKDNIITVFGLNTFKCLEPFNLALSEGCQVEGFLSKPGPGTGRNSGDRQFFYVNGRPVDMPKVTKLVNELYRSSNSRQYPVAVLNFCIPTTSYDVNVAPDKRKIFFSSEHTILFSLREAIENLYSPQQCSFSINHIEDPEKVNHTEDPVKEDDPMVDEPIKSTYLMDKENVSSPENDNCKEDTDSDDQDPLKDQKVSSSATRVATGAASGDMSPLPRSPDTEVDRSPWFSALRYEQPKRPRADFRSNPVRENHVRTGLAAQSSPSTIVQSSLMNFLSLNKRKHEDSCNLITEAPVLRRGTCSGQVRRTSLEANAPGISDANSLQQISLWDHSPQPFVPKRTEVSLQHSEPPNVASPSTEAHLLNPCDVHSTEFDVDEQNDRCLSNFGAPDQCLKDTEPPNTPSNITLLDGHDNDTSVCSTSVSYSVQFTIDELRRRRKRGFIVSRENRVHCSEKTARCYKAATLDNYVPNDDEGKSNYLAAATNELDRFFSKDNFGEMKVVGQFNLGFIIGKLEQDLFIVDQHAADEKYNFESLSQSTTLNIQPLLQPLRLELSPEEEVIVSMHMNTIRKNGFVLAEDLHASPGSHYLLKAVPFSKNITFGVQDVKELICMLSDSQGDCSIISSYKMDKTDSVCPSRVRAMFASRACRMSTMIGDPLTKTEMKKILKNLTGLRSPWNCPHGRPTMRHLADLTSIRSKEAN